MREKQSEKGSALMGVLLLIVILSMLATVSLNLAAQEVEGLAASREDAAARHLAEAGADLVMQWLHDPSSAPPGLSDGLLARRQQDGSGAPSFFDAAGRSQFTGTPARPDLLYDAGNPADHRLLNDPAAGWFRALGSLGKIQRLVLHGPAGPGLLCTVEVTARAGRITRTIATQLGVRTLPPLRAGVQIGARAPLQAAPQSLPVWVHWGGLVVNGDVQLGAAREIPGHSVSASVTGQSYADMSVPEDRWLNVFAGGTAFTAPDPAGSLPAHVHAQQEPVPGLRLDRWEYQMMKDAALRDGTYYARGRDGLLYRDGRIEPGLGVTPDEAFRSAAVGETRGLVFVDTLDQAPPGTDNLGTLLFDSDYAEGVFVINAHVRFAPRGTGRTLAVFSPPRDEQAGAGARAPVELSGIHLRGALVVSGDLSIEGRPRLFGAMNVGGTIGPASDSTTRLELWYDDDFRTGLFRGLPVVFQSAGTWRER